MSKRSSKRKRRSKALPALGFAGVSLSMASGACASISEASANTPPPSQGNELFLGEEELSDVSLATFYVFDKENAGLPPPAQRIRLARCGGGVLVAADAMAAEVDAAVAAVVDAVVGMEAALAGRTYAPQQKASFLPALFGHNGSCHHVVRASDAYLPPSY